MPLSPGAGHQEGELVKRVPVGDAGTPEALLAAVLTDAPLVVQERQLLVQAPRLRAVGPDPPVGFDLGDADVGQRAIAVQDGEIALVEDGRQVVEERQGVAVPQLLREPAFGLGARLVGEASNTLAVAEDGEQRAVITRSPPRQPVDHATLQVDDHPVAEVQALVGLEAPSELGDRCAILGEVRAGQAVALGLVGLRAGAPLGHAVLARGDHVAKLELQ